MKTSNFIHKTLVVLLLIIVKQVSLPAQTYTKQREVSKSFRVFPESIVQVNNKYGNINIVPWQNDSVRIEVRMVVQGKQVTKVDKIMSSIDFELMSFGNYINARTFFRDNQATFWKDVVAYAGQVITTSNNLQIDYTIYIPPSLDLRIENKFGNIYMESHSGEIDIKLSNGDLQARDFTGSLTLNLEFGSGSMKHVEKGAFNINYSDVSIEKISSLSLDSRSSTIEIESAGAVDLNSQRDKIFIKDCSSIHGDASFSKVKITRLESAILLMTKYGEVRINEVVKNFRNIRLTSEYTDIFIDIDPASTFALDLTYDAKTRLGLSSALSNQLKKELLDVKTGRVNAVGNTGRQGNSLLFVNCKSGALTIFHK